MKTQTRNRLSRVPWWWILSMVLAGITGKYTINGPVNTLRDLATAIVSFIVYVGLGALGMAMDFRRLHKRGDLS